MKNKFLMVATALIALVSTSCTKETETSQPELKHIPIIINAGYEGNNTKVSYSESGTTISATWQAGDKILVAYDGCISELTLASGAGTASATFTGEIYFRTEPNENSILACYVQDANNAAALTIEGSNIIYSDAAFLRQTGLLSSACKCNTFFGMSKFGDGTNIKCNFRVNTSMLKLTIHAPENVVAATEGATLAYLCGSDTLAKATFKVANDCKNNIYMAVPAGVYSGVQKLVYKSGEIEKSYVLSDHATFMPGETYKKNNITFGYVRVALLDADYEAISGDKITGTLSLSARTISIPNNATVTLDNVTATSKALSLKGTGNATIVLSGVNTLNNSQTVSVVSGKTLTIQGDGTLNVTTSSYGTAAIGSYSGTACGNIVISGGTINARANGTGYAAGIGCGATATCGNITIDSGTVVATGKNGAGIGANSSSSTNICGSIEIIKGEVTAYGNGNGTAGIGTGNSSKSTCGTITIRNTVTGVTATKGSGATASIGKGHPDSACGTVTIEAGANVTQN